MLPNNKAYGLYSCPVSILNLSSRIISKPRAQIFNVSVSSGSFPAKLKTAKVVPVFKSGDESKPGNYRPISLLSIFCNPKIPWERAVGHVNNMMRRMQYSGYSKGFRYEIVQSALHAYKKIQELDQTGVKPMYRPKEWRQNERRKEKEEKRRSWYRKGNYSSVIFVLATPESSLKRSLDEDVKKSGLWIRIVEKSGMSVKRVLQRSDPFKKRTCERECCFVYRTGGRGPCDSFGVTYEIKCQTCEQKYVGETVRSAFCVKKTCERLP